MRGEVDRRRFIQGVALAGTTCALASCTRAPARWRFLSDKEAELVDLITEQIIPGDQDPGARDAGVVNFIDKQLAGPYARYQGDYRNGLSGVEETSRGVFARPFAALKWEEQAAVLQALQSGEAVGKTWEVVSSAGFFELIRDHTMQGFYGSPRHGGNKGYVSFRLLKIDYPQIIGQNRYVRESD